MKKIIFTSIFVIFNLLLCVVGLEIFVRVKFSEILDFRSRELQYRRADFTLDHSFIPGVRAVNATKEWNVPYAINSFGFRDREFPLEKTKNVFRILALGDSYVEGYGVRAEESFIKLFEGKLNQNAKAKHYEVINGGIASYSPILEYLLLSHRALELHPDLVVLVYDVGDLKDDYEYEKTTVVDGQGRPLKSAPFDRAWASNATALQRFLIRHSRAYLYLDNKLNKFFFKWQNRHKKFQNEYTDEVPHDSFIAYREGQYDKVKILWQRNRKYLGMIADLLKQNHIRLVIVSYPYGFQFNPEEWAQGRLNQGFKSHTVYPEPTVLQDIAAFAKEKDIPFLDLYQSVKSRYVFPIQYKFDGHLNQNGHRIMAEALYDEMSKLSIDGSS